MRFFWMKGWRVFFPQPQSMNRRRRNLKVCCAVCETRSGCVKITKALKTVAKQKILHAVDEICSRKSRSAVGQSQPWNIFSARLTFRKKSAQAERWCRRQICCRPKQLPVTWLTMSQLYLYIYIEIKTFVNFKNGTFCARRLEALHTNI